MMHSHLKVLLVDDDEWYCKAFRVWFERTFPDVSLHVRNTPDVRGDFCVYLLDNQFHGHNLAGKLAAELREGVPHALVLAVSGSLDVVTLKNLLNAGCHGAFAKGSNAELDQLETVLRAHLHEVDREWQSSQKGFLATLRSIADLLRAWNARLDRQEKSA